MEYRDFMVVALPQPYHPLYHRKSRLQLDKEQRAQPINLTY